MDMPNNIILAIFIFISTCNQNFFDAINKTVEETRQKIEEQQSVVNGKSRKDITEQILSDNLYRVYKLFEENIATHKNDKLNQEASISFINNLTQILSKLVIKDVSISPKQKRTNNEYTYAPYSLEFSCNYIQFGMFLASLAANERLIQIDEFKFLNTLDLATRELELGKKRLPDAKTTITISTVTLTPRNNTLTTNHINDISNIANNNFWASTLFQLARATPNNMCITKLEYINDTLNISAISKFSATSKDHQILNKFITRLQAKKSFSREFSNITITNSRRVSHKKSPYYSFQISAPRIKHRQTNNVHLAKNIQTQIRQLEEALINRQFFSFGLPADVNPSNLESVIDFKNVWKKNQHFQIENIWFSSKRQKHIATLMNTYGELIYNMTVKDSIAGGAITEISDAHITFEKNQEKFTYFIKGSPEDLLIEAAEKNRKSNKKYTKEIEDAAKKLAMQRKKSPLTIQRFQEATGIANENDSNFGKWDKKTRETYKDVLKSIVKNKEDTLKPIKHIIY